MTTGGGGGRHERVFELFDRAADLPEAERGALLDRECAGDDALRADVASLLARAPGAGGRLRAKVAAEAERVVAARTGARPGARLGPWRLIEQIGEGGMGVVYLAERDDDAYTGRAAVKILRGLVSEAAVARFRDERQILAMLEHPGIVRLRDAGSTEDGLPYLVLDLVDGERITDYARGRGLRPREIVGLVLRVCDALQYAHARPLVHRDIKPSNILVDRSGVPKLLDFGIAKFDPRAGVAREARTRTGAARLLTLEYASPEQAKGEPILAISVATDIYSLGVVLYELVTGRLPHEPRGDDLELLRAVCHDDPPRPSAVAPPELRREIAGDLDKIIEKALRKQPAERYATVEQFADDLRRYLDGRPVAARTKTFGYRADRFVRRNWGKLAVAGLVAGALSTAAVVSWQQASRAETEARWARELANALLFEIDDELRDVAGATHARELLVSRGLAYFDQMAGQPGPDAALRRELALGYMKIGDIQGDPWGPNIGKPSEGLKSYQKAEGVLASLDPADPAVAVASQRAAFGTGFMHHSVRDLARARKMLDDALSRARAAPPGLEPAPVTVARAHLALAYNEKADDLDGADRRLDEGLALVEGWGADEPESRYWRAVFLLQRADVAARAGDPGRALDALREILAIHRALADEHPTVATYRREYALALMLRGIVAGGVGDSRLWVADAGDLDEAEGSFRQVLAIAERTLADDPKNADAKMSVAVHRTSLGLAVAKRSPRDAIAAFQQALEAFEAVPGELRDGPYGRGNEFILHCAMGAALAAAKAPGAQARALIGLKLSAGNPFHQAMCETLVARMALDLDDRETATARLESVWGALAPLAGRPDTSALIGLVDALDRLAALHPAEACTLRAEALARWSSRPANTPYLRRRAAELASAAARCAPTELAALAAPRGPLAPFRVPLDVSRGAAIGGGGCDYKNRSRKASRRKKKRPRW